MLIHSFGIFTFLREKWVAGLRRAQYTVLYTVIR